MTEITLDNMPPLMDTKTLAKVLALTPAWAEHARWKGTGPPFIKVGASVRYKREDVHEWLKNQTKTKAGKPPNSCPDKLEPRNQDITRIQEGMAKHDIMAENSFISNFSSDKDMLLFIKLTLQDIICGATSMGDHLIDIKAVKRALKYTENLKEKQ